MACRRRLSARSLRSTCKQREAERPAPAPAPSRMCAQARGQRSLPLAEPRDGAVEAVPRHTEIPDLLARKICRGLGVPGPF